MAYAAVAGVFARPCRVAAQRRDKHFMICVVRRRRRPIRVQIVHFEHGEVRMRGRVGRGRPVDGHAKLCNS